MKSVNLSELSHDKQMEDEIRENLKYDFDRLYALFDSEFQSKSSPDDLGKKDKENTGAVTK